MSTMTPVVTASDHSFVPGLYALLNSLKYYSPNRPIHILDCGIKAEDRGVLDQRFASLHWLSINSEPDLLFPSVGSHATYARFLIGDIFADYSRVLYLDADIVVVSDIAEIDGIALDSSHIIGACHEPYTPTFAAHNGVHDFRRLGFDGGEPYFNAGVLLICPDAWRREKISERAVAYLKRTDVKITLYDQEALNVALAGRWTELAPEWNVSRFWLKAERRELRPAILDQAKLVHFLSEAKPWLAQPNTHPWLLAHYRRFAADGDPSS